MTREFSTTQIGSLESSQFVMPVARLPDRLTILNRGLLKDPPADDPSANLVMDIEDASKPLSTLDALAPSVTDHADRVIRFVMASGGALRGDPLTKISNALGMDRATALSALVELERVGFLKNSYQL